MRELWLAKIVRGFLDLKSLLNSVSARCSTMEVIEALLEADFWR